LFTEFSNLFRRYYQKNKRGPVSGTSDKGTSPWKMDLLCYLPIYTRNVVIISSPILHALMQHSLNRCMWPVPVRWLAPVDIIFFHVTYRSVTVGL